MSEMNKLTGLIAKQMNKFSALSKAVGQMSEMNKIRETSFKTLLSKTYILNDKHGFYNNNLFKTINLYNDVLLNYKDSNSNNLLNNKYYIDSNIKIDEVSDILLNVSLTL